MHTKKYLQNIEFYKKSNEKYKIQKDISWKKILKKKLNSQKRL